MVSHIGPADNFSPWTLIETIEFLFMTYQDVCRVGGLNKSGQGEG